MLELLSLIVLSFIGLSIIIGCASWLFGLKLGWKIITFPLAMPVVFMLITSVLYFVL